jgi:excisionase family DNA binding protein
LLRGMETNASDAQRDRLLSTRDVRAFLNCSRNTVARMVATGKLRQLKLGRAVRFHPDDVRQMIEDLRR